MLDSFVGAVSLDKALPIVASAVRIAGGGLGHREWYEVVVLCI